MRLADKNAGKSFVRTPFLAMCLGFLIAVFPGSLSAHSFETLLIVPSGTENEQIRDDMKLAFLIAGVERDNHPDNHADGHLGGLDVYLTVATLAEADRLRETSPDILAVPLLGGEGTDLVEIAVQLGAVPVGAIVLTGAFAQEFLMHAASPEFQPFSTRFMAETGRMPGPEAKAAYVIARRIDLALRELGGVDDAARLAKLLSD